MLNPPSQKKSCFFSKRGYILEHFVFFMPIFNCDFDSKRLHKCSRIATGHPRKLVIFSKRYYKIELFFPPPPGKSLFFASKHTYNFKHFFDHFWPIIERDFEPKRCHKCSRPPPSQVFLKTGLQYRAIF